MIVLVLFQRVDLGHECCLEPDVFVAKTERLAVRKAIRYLLSLDEEMIHDDAANLKAIVKVRDLGDWLYEHYNILDCYSKPHR